jgi:glycosyltransferase involved in cell wall biosynthesis
MGVWRALRGSPTPYFVFTHGMLDPWFKQTYPLKHLKKWLYWPWGDYRVLRDATAVLFTCEEERRLARQSFWLYKCDECVVNYGTAGPEGDAVAQKRLFLEKFPRLAGKRCLLFLGRVHVKKGPDLLLHALGTLLREAPPELTRDIHLIMAGPNDHAYGKAMAALAKKLGLEDRITWTGMVTGDLKWGAFYAADAFILPSHQENFGIAVAEALACGAPVLISNKVNIWREIQLHRAGLVETDTLEGTLLLLQRWLRLSPEELATMRASASECFLQRFHVNQTANIFIQALHTFGLRHLGEIDRRTGANLSGKRGPSLTGGGSGRTG